MTQEAAFMVFMVEWGTLLFIAALSQLLFADMPKKSADFLANMLVVTPFVLVLGLFYFRGYVGTFEGNSASRISGTVTSGAGMIGYITSLLSLGRNWSLSASVKQGQKLVTTGPYRFVRHPMYSSMTLVVLGSGLLTANYLILLSTPLVSLVYYIRAKKEEALLKEEFPGYSRYAAETKMFVPWLF